MIKLRGANTDGYLTRREMGVWKLVADGYSNKMIADLWGVSIKTVGHARARLLKKLGVNNETQLVRAAFAYGVVTVRVTPIVRAEYKGKYVARYYLPDAQTAGAAGGVSASKAVSLSAIPCERA